MVTPNVPPECPQMCQRIIAPSLLSMCLVHSQFPMGVGRPLRDNPRPIGRDSATMAYEIVCSLSNIGVPGHRNALSDLGDMPMIGEVRSRMVARTLIFGSDRA
jgi:hypothetical protein